MKSKELIPLAKSLGYDVEFASDRRHGFGVRVGESVLSFMWDRGNYCDARYDGEPSDSETVEAYNYTTRNNPVGWMSASAVADLLRLLAPKSAQDEA